MRIATFPSGWSLYGVRFTHKLNFVFRNEYFEPLKRPKNTASRGKTIVLSNRRVLGRYKIEPDKSDQIR